MSPHRSPPSSFMADEIAFVVDPNRDRYIFGPVQLALGSAAPIVSPTPTATRSVFAISLSWPGSRIRRYQSPVRSHRKTHLSKKKKKHARQIGSLASHAHMDYDHDLTLDDAERQAIIDLRSPSPPTSAAPSPTLSAFLRSCTAKAPPDPQDISHEALSHLTALAYIPHAGQKTDLIQPDRWSQPPGGAMSFPSPAEAIIPHTPPSTPLSRRNKSHKMSSATIERPSMARTIPSLSPPRSMQRIYQNDGPASFTAALTPDTSPEPDAEETVVRPSQLCQATIDANDLEGDAQTRLEYHEYQESQAIVFHRSAVESVAFRDEAKSSKFDRPSADSSSRKATPATITGPVGIEVSACCEPEPEGFIAPKNHPEALDGRESTPAMVNPTGLEVAKAKRVDPKFKVERKAGKKAKNTTHVELEPWQDLDRLLRKAPSWITRTPTPHFDNDLAENDSPCSAISSSLLPSPTSNSVGPRDHGSMATGTEAKHEVASTPVQVEQAEGHEDADDEVTDEEVDQLNDEEDVGIEDGVPTKNADAMSNQAEAESTQAEDQHAITSRHTAIISTEEAKLAKKRKGSRRSDNFGRPIKRSRTDRVPSGPLSWKAIKRRVSQEVLRSIGAVTGRASQRSRAPLGSRRDD